MVCCFFAECSSKASWPSSWSSVLVASEIVVLCQCFFKACVCPLLKALSFSKPRRRIKSVSYSVNHVNYSGATEVHDNCCRRHGRLRRYQKNNVCVSALFDTLRWILWRFLLPAIAQYKPTDATTNPSLVLAAALKEQYAKVVDEAVSYGKQHGKYVVFTADTRLSTFYEERKFYISADLWRSKSKQLSTNWSVSESVVFLSRGREGYYESHDSWWHDHFIFDVQHDIVQQWALMSKGSVEPEHKHSKFRSS